MRTSQSARMAIVTSATWSVICPRTAFEMSTPPKRLRRAESTAGNVLRRAHDQAREGMEGTGGAIGGSPGTSATACNESNEGARGQRR